MKKSILIACFLTVATALTAIGATGDLTRTPGTFANQVAVQIFGPNGAATDTLSVNPSTIDLTNYILYSIWSASGTCKARLMPLSTSTKASYTQVTIPNTTWHIRAKNYNTPFLNMSGCVGGFVEKQ